MLDLPNWLEGVSVLGILIIIGLVVFAESGLLVGLLLPGDTLLLTAGFFAAQDQLPLGWVMVVIFVGAVLGDNIGYFFGNKTGPRVFKRSDGVLFRSEYLDKARAFYQRHGGKAVTLARFIPYARSLAPMVAGAANMRRIKFILYDMVGALFWTVSFVLLGYWLGVKAAELIEQYAWSAAIVCLLFVFSPTVVYLVRSRRARQYLAGKLKSLLRL